MKRFRKIIPFCLLALVFACCETKQNEATGGMQPRDIIPAPVEYSVRPGSIPATLLPTSDFTLISSTDSTIVVSVNPTGGPSYGSIAFGLSSSNFNYLNSISSVGDVVIWQTGTFPDNMGAIEAYVVQPNVNVCLLSRFGLAANGFLWKTDASGWTILRKLLQEATFHYSNSWQNAPSQLDIAVDISNPFGNITTLTKTIYLTE